MIGVFEKSQNALKLKLTWVFELWHLIMVVVMIMIVFVVVV